MPIDGYTVITPSSKEHHFMYFLKKYVAVYVSVALVFVSFFGGYAFGQQRASVGSTATAQAEKGDKSNTIPGILGKLIGSKQPPKNFLDKAVDFTLMWDVWKIVKNDYFVKNTPDTKLFYGALSGIVSSVGDPYTVFFDPDTAKKFDEEMQGSFEGIGAEIGMKNNVVTVIAPLPDTPAEKAGLRAGDKILAIDGKTTSGMTVDEAVNKIRGKGGTQVELKMFRDGDREERKVTIVRDTIVVASVKWEVKNNNVGYIKVSQFNQDTESKFHDAVNDLLGKKVKSIVIDLRNDPGGYLDTAIEVIGYWVEGKTAVIEKYNDDKQDSYVAKRSRPVLADLPTVVLVNQGSASASEIVSGALQDYGKAKLVGKTTFGKGSVQDLKDLPDGSKIKITVAKWLTPKGTSISDHGIKPDVEVDISEDDYKNNKDPQLDKALEMLK